MSEDLVKRLRDWEHVWPEDENEPEGNLYIAAADRIEELEAKLAKAVELALEECPFRCGTPDYDNWWRDYRSTLAGLTGGKDE